MATVTFKQADTISEVISITSQVDDSVIDITGGTVKFRIVTKLSDLKAAAVYNNDAVTITDATAGEATLAITRAVTKVWTPGTYFWEVEYVDSSTNFSHTDSDILIIEKSVYSDDT